jgi:putative SOS response-associated peptidase YedK
MCGRFVGYRKLGDYRSKFQIDLFEAHPAPNYNIAPTQSVPAVVRQEDKNVLRTFRWGLVPFWAQDPAMGNRMINARAETVDTKPAFRNAFRKRRCLITADGFYEWQGPKGNKQPMYITLPDDEPFGFAGLYEYWDDKGRAQEPIRSCTILTTAASESIKYIHHRMPVILKPEAFRDWMRPDTPPQDLKAIISSHIQTTFRCHPVSKAVNAVKNNTPELIKAQ